MTAAALAGGALIAVGAGPADALDNGLAITPPMGWNSWNQVRCTGLNEDVVKHAADELVSTGLRDKGYDYVVVDDCWQAFQRAADGSLQANPDRFPDGMKALADYVHSKGLKFGIYAAPGSHTCAMTWDNYPGDHLGSLGHEQQDADTFESWGVDYLKYDLCQAETIDGIDPIAAFKKMRDILAGLDRPITYSISEYGQYKPWTWGQDVANLWRTTSDLGPSWASVSNVIDSQAALADYSGRPGGWNDPDMLQIGNGTLTPTENQTHFSFWSLLNAPLFLGTDIGKLTAANLATVGNPEVIAVDQDFAGQQGRRIRDDGDTEVWGKRLSDGGFAAILYNASAKTQAVSTSLSELGLGSKPHGWNVRDLWSHQDLGSTQAGIGLTVAPHGVRMLRLEAASKSEVPMVSASLTPTEIGMSTTTDAVLSVTNDGTLALQKPTLSVTQGEVGVVTHGSLPQTLAAGATAKIPVTLTAPATIGVRAITGTVTGKTSLGSQPLPFAAEVAVVPPVPTGDAYASDLTWVSSSNGWGPVERDETVGGSAAGDGGPITLNGTTYQKGLGTNSPSTVRVYTGGNCTRFTADFGVDDDQTSAGSVTFSVVADGATKASTGVLTPSSDTAHLSADISGAKYVDLVVGDGGDGNGNDHGDWADPVFHCVGSDLKSPTIFLPGQAQDVTMGLTAGATGATDVTTQLTAPAGWTATPTSPTTAASVAPGARFTTTWSVTPPADATPGNYQLTGQASYTVDGKTTTDTRTAAVNLARSAHYVYSQAYDDGPSYKRLTRQIAVPAGGGSLTFWTDYATEQGWDYMFVEAHTPGQDDWTTLPDANGHTSTATGDSCANGWVSLHPQMAHYQTYSNGSCTPTGTTGSWNAATGSSGGWQQWKVDLSKWAGQTVEVSIGYASDWGTNGRGVFVDDTVLPDGTTSTFEDGALDGWTVPGAPTGEPANPNDYVVTGAAQSPAP